jgi:pyruvate ferredoxin oxidoreductase alpha subunit
VVAKQLAEEKLVAQRRVAATGNYAAAYAARDADIDVVAVYPITPQVQIAEKLAEMIANGELDAEMIHVESEHSAMSAVIAAAATGARTFTATSSQGLELMHEMLWIAAGLRQPVVMAVATRALSAPINIWNDYTDVISARDTGWIILFSENVQEVYDNVIQAFRIAEHPDVLLPVMVALDGYILSHTVEPMYRIPRDEVLDYAPKRPRGYRPVLDPDKPVTMGVLAAPNWYYEIKRQQAEAMRASKKVIVEAGREFGRRFGRYYDLLEPYMLDDAEYVMVSMGATASLVKAAVRRLRREGLKVGAVKVRVYRPFPADELAKMLEGVKAVAVLDRAIAFGGPSEGPLFSDVAVALAVRGISIPMVGFVHGLGGRDIFVRDVVDMFNKLVDYAQRGVSSTYTIFYGVRE